MHEDAAQLHDGGRDLLDVEDINAVRAEASCTRLVLARISHTE
jgi:hypothetical protein